MTATTDTSARVHGAALLRVESALRAHGSRTNGAAPGMWTCPAHDDRRPSLHVEQGDQGAVIYCHAGCPLEKVLAALQLVPADLFDAPRPDGRPKSRARGAAPRTRVAAYLYTDRSAE